MVLCFVQSHEDQVPVLAKRKRTCQITGSSLMDFDGYIPEEPGSSPMVIIHLNTYTPSNRTNARLICPLYSVTIYRQNECLFSNIPQ